MIAVGEGAGQQVGFFHTVAEVMWRNIAAGDEWIGDIHSCRIGVCSRLCKDNYNLIIKQIFLRFFHYYWYITIRALPFLVTAKRPVPLPDIVRQTRKR